MIIQCPYCNVTTAGQHELNCPNRATIFTDYQRGYDEGYRDGKKEGREIIQNIIKMHEGDFI